MVFDSFWLFAGCVGSAPCLRDRKPQARGEARLGRVMTGKGEVGLSLLTMPWNERFRL